MAMKRGWRFLEAIWPVGADAEKPATGEGAGYVPTLQADDTVKWRPPVVPPAPEDADDVPYHLVIDQGTLEPAWEEDTGGAGVTDGDKGDIVVSDDGDTWTIDDGVVSGAKTTNNVRDVIYPIVFGHPSSAVLATGTHAYGILNQYSGTIVAWTVTTDASATVTVDIKAASYSGWPTTTTIWGGSKPSITGARKNQATGLSVAITAGDLWDIVLDANNNARQIILNLVIRRS